MNHRILSIAAIAAISLVPLYMYLSPPDTCASANAHRVDLDLDDPHALRDFIHQFDACTETEPFKLEHLDDASWAAAMQANTLESVQSYIQNFPNDANPPGRHLAAAERDVFTRTAPADADQREQWESDAAVAIVTGHPIPIERRAHIQTLDISGWSHLLFLRLEAEGADLSNYYVNPERGASPRILKPFDLTPLQDLTGLQTLNASDAQVNDLSPLKNLTELREINVSNTHIDDLTPLANLTELRRLSVYNTRIDDFSQLRNMIQLQELDVSGTQIVDISPLRNLTRLQTLNVSNMQIDALTPMENLSALRELYIAETSIDDLTPLQNLTALEVIAMRNTQVDNLSPLQNLPALREVFAQETKVTDFSPVNHVEYVLGDPSRQSGFRR